MLEKAWQLEGGTLVDLKVEFGYDTKGRLLLADVIDNNSWRVVESGAYIDKQVYRDGGALDDVAAKYRRVAEITGRFRVPRQRIILWRGSESDKTEPFAEALGDAQGHDDGRHLLGAQGAGAAARTLQRLLQDVPDTVVIAYIGRSNGAGPTLSALSPVPGHHSAGERQGLSRGCVVVAARAEQRAGDDGARAVERGARRAADPLRAQSAPLRARAQRYRVAGDQCDRGSLARYPRTHEN